MKEPVANVTLASYVMIGALIHTLRAKNVLSEDEVKDMLDNALTHLENALGPSSDLAGARQLVESAMRDLP